MLNTNVSLIINVNISLFLHIFFYIIYILQIYIISFKVSKKRLELKPYTNVDYDIKKKHVEDLNYNKTML